MPHARNLRGTLAVYNMDMSSTQITLNSFIELLMKADNILTLGYIGANGVNFFISNTARIFIQCVFLF